MVWNAKKVVVSAFAGISLLLCQSSAQVVSINTPAQWSTLRSDSIVVKAQIDTALSKKKVVDYTLSSVVGGVSKVIAKKQIKVSDISNDAFITKLNTNLIGGTDFLKIEWAADSQSGSTVPFGIVDLSKLPKISPLNAHQVNDAVSLKAMAEGIKDDQFTKISNDQFAVAWNSKALFFVIKKTADTSALEFSLDGKNGKNAFIAYADRFVGCKKDSVWGTHYSRSIVNDTLKYSTLTWDNEITKEKTGDKLVIRMPWYDTGIVPFNGRTVGFAAFKKENGKVTGTSPEKAQQFIPGTWGSLVLVK